MKEKPQHTVEECNKKLAALIDKLQNKKVAENQRLKCICGTKRR